MRSEILLAVISNNKEDFDYVIASINVLLKEKCYIKNNSLAYIHIITNADISDDVINFAYSLNIEPKISYKLIIISEDNITNLSNFVNEDDQRLNEIFYIKQEVGIEEDLLNE